MIQKKYMVVVILLIFILACALLSDMFHNKFISEYFTDTAPTDNVLLNYVREKSSAYFPLFGDFFFSNTSLTNSKINPNIARQMFQFLPTYGDSICANVEPNQPMSCSNVFINNISYTDPVNYRSLLECSSIDSGISPDKSQCLVRILNNKYSLQKKCIRLNTNSNLNKTNTVLVNSISSLRSFGTPIISEALQLGTSSNSTIVKIQGNLDIFALLQPTLISIGNFGVYHIDYNANDFNNMFTSYNSVDSNPKSVILQNLGSSNINIFPGKIANLTQLLQKPNWNIMSTIYYLNYENSIVVNETETVNTFNIVFDKKYVSTLLNNDAKDKTIDIAITPNSTDFSTISYVSGISFKFNFDEKLNSPFLKILLNYGTSSSPSKIFECNKTFSNRVYELIKRNELNSNDKMFHVIVTCTLDKIKMLTLYKEVLNNIYEFQIMSSSLKNSETPVFVQYNLKDLKSIANNTLLDHYKTQYTNLCPYTAIPNYALLAKRLGYVI